MEEDVIQLDIPMQNVIIMTVLKSLRDLLEDVLCLLLPQSAFILDVLEKVAVTCVLHHKEDVLFILKDLEQPDDVLVHRLLKYPHLLENLLDRGLILQSFPFNALQCHVFPCQNLHPKMNLPESSLPDEPLENIVIQGRRRCLPALGDLELDLVDEVLTLAEELGALIDREFEEVVQDEVVNRYLRIGCWLVDSSGIGSSRELVEVLLE